MTTLRSALNLAWMKRNNMYLEEVADEARVSVSTVRHWIRTKKLPSYRPGRRRIIRREDFEAFMRSRPSSDR